MDLARTTAHRIWGVLILNGLLAVVGGCAPTVEHYGALHQHLQSEDYAAALNAIQAAKTSYPERDAVIYHLEEGIVRHFAGHYRISCQSLFKAEAMMAALYTESISRNVGSFLINDNTIAYRGEDFEQVLVNLFLAINYACLGMTEDALVEARKVDSKLNLINSRYPDGQKNVYREDGFVRYLMGTLYAMADEVNDAFVSYRMAERVYREDYRPNYGVAIPEFLIEDLLTTATELGFHREVRQLKRRYPHISPPDVHRKNRLAELIVLHYNGRGAEKAEAFWLVPMPDGYIAKIAYPEFRRPHYLIHHAVVTLRQASSQKQYRFETVLMEDISAIAEKNLENRILRIKTKAVARATGKYLMTREAAAEAEEKKGEWAGRLVRLAGNIVGHISENADTRHWRLLPAEIRVGRAWLPPGRYSGKIDFVGSDGAIVFSRPIPHVQLGQGRKRFIIQRTMQ